MTKSRRGKTTKVKRRKAPAAPRRKAPARARSKPAASAHGQASDSIDPTALLAERDRELAQALERETATAEVLRIIVASPGELEPVFQALLAHAVRICGASFGNLLLREKDGLRQVARQGAARQYEELRRRNPIVPIANVLGQIVETTQTVHVADLAADERYAASNMVRLAGARTFLGVPLMKGRELIGVIAIYRREVQPFTDRQIGLLTAFADQAVIAIENARLQTAEQARAHELSAALERQSATSEVLAAISGSPGEPAAAFDTLLANAARICGARHGAVLLADGDAFRPVALCGAPRAFVEERLRGPVLRPAAETPLGLVAATRQPAQVADVAGMPTHAGSDPFAVGGADLVRHHTVLAVPMLKGEELIGAIALFRQEVRPYSDTQVALVETFAAQAVIAIENARLLADLRRRTDDLSESLQQQTATADVLRLISRSALDLQKVLDTLTESAATLCRADRAAIRLEQDGIYHHRASFGFTPEQKEYMRSHTWRPDRTSVGGRAMLESRSVQVDDVMADPELRLMSGPGFTNVRTTLGVPLLREGAPIGALILTRSIVEPFTDKLIALVESFADQAVIAIQNARLFEEVRSRTQELSEALEQQTATSEVLQVISSSPGELKAVFNTMVERATHLCSAEFGTLELCKEGGFSLAALHGAPPAYAEYRQQHPIIHPAPASALGRVAGSKSVVHVTDMMDLPEAARGHLARLAGARTLLAVPLLKDEQLLGAMGIYRQEPRPFTDKQIALVQSFAAQAVIAIENARLLGELRQRTDDLSEALDQQTATAEVLEVISRSPSDLDPVFEAILANATRICGAKFGVLWLSEGDAYRAVALHGAPPAFAEARRRNPLRKVNPGTSLGRVAATRQTVQIADIRQDPAFTSDPTASAMLELAGARTMVNVPMLKENDLIGQIAIYHQEVRPFTDKQIALVQNFAAQAVIAIENARLLAELRQRTDDLSEALDQQTATAEVLKVISSSPDDLGPVFEAMLESATRICGAKFGVLWQAEGQGYRSVAMCGVPPDYASAREREPVIYPGPEVPLARIGLTKQVLQVADIREDESYIKGFRPIVNLADNGGARTLLMTPMLKENELIGAMAIFRQEVRPFSDKQIELVQNFAAQAVIAIENARLLGELRQRTDDLSEALEQQTATSEVLKVISSSPGELEPVFRAMLANAMRICEADFGILFRFADGAFRGLSWLGIPPAFAEFLREPRIWGPETGLGRLVATRHAVHVVDTLADRAYANGDPDRMAAVGLGGVRTFVIVPMIKEGELVGAFSIFRQDVRPFTDKQIALVQNFAAQAVIAIENARLLAELRQRTDDLSEALEQQTATSEVLQVVSRSPGDLDPVFDAMLANATRICGAQFGLFYRYDGDMFRLSAARDVPPALTEFLRELGAFQPPPGTPLHRLLVARDVVHDVDVTTEQKPGPPARLGGAKSQVVVPLFKDADLIGAIVIYRTEVRPFTDKQIALVQNFAAQAVIAIENARLLAELQQRTDDLSEALEQQTATSEVLKVISSSPGELEPVFDVMLANATRICGARFGVLHRHQDGKFLMSAELNTPPALAEFNRQRGWFSPSPGSVLEEIIRTSGVVHRSDDAAGDMPSANVRLDAARTLLAVPLLKEEALLGALGIYRQEPRPFTDKQIALVQNFAAQAVIAIENARLLGELRESLQQQTATADVLKTISRSTFDLQSVLDTLVESAARLCGANRSAIRLARDGLYHEVASFGFTAEHMAYMRTHPVAPDRGSVAGRVGLEGRVVHVADIRTDPDFKLAAAPGVSPTVLGVPLLREGVPIGVLLLTRPEVGLFTERQIELASTFADQAVIAIENARLLAELRHRTDDLSEALEQQTATSEVLDVISSSLTDTQPVFDAIVRSGLKLFGDAAITIALPRGDQVVAGAIADVDPARAQALRQRLPIPLKREFMHSLAIIDARTIDIPDVDNAPADLAPGARNFRASGFRAVTIVPMMREGAAIGALSVARVALGPLSAKQNAMLETFAAQAVIAIENARLLAELRQRTDDLSEALEQQTATSEVLQVISRSPGTLQPVFDAMLDNAVRICEARFGLMFRFESDETSYAVATRNVPPALEEYQRQRGRRRPTAGSDLESLWRSKQVVQTLDALETPNPSPISRLAGARTHLAVPMLKDDTVVGAIIIYRTEVRPFTDNQIELVQNFAAQAVIAIENTRLLAELRESLQRQTATAEVLKVISRSTFDLQVVLDTLTESAGRLSEADMAAMTRQSAGGFHHVTSWNFPPDWIDYNKSVWINPGRGSVVGRVLLERRPVQVEDVLADPEYTYLEPAKKAGYRTFLAVPLLRDGAPIGVMTLGRKTVRPFTAEQIELVTTFADQAVIAIENVRLFDEVEAQRRDLTEALAHQTATSEILGVISRSPTDTRPVFDAIVASAARLCEAVFSVVWLYDGDQLRLAASSNFTSEVIRRIQQSYPRRPDRSTVGGRAVLDAKVAHIPDTLADPEYAHDLAVAGNWRAVASAPMLRDGRPVGAISVGKAEPVPFSDRQIKLLITFADQAVIAIENARLFEAEQARTRELAQSLEDLEAAQDRLVQTQKLASLGQLTAGIAHEIKNPLNFVNNFATLSGELIDELREALPRGRFDEETRIEIEEIAGMLRGNLDKIEQHGKRADSIVKNMLLHSREGAGEHRPVDVNALVEESLNLAYHGARAEKSGFNVTLERSLDPAAGQADVFPQEITRVLLNLIANGFYATAKRKEAAGDGFEPVLAAATKDLGDRVEIMIRDNGTGIPPEVKERMFNPFFTTKPAGEGTGLGLSLSHDIVVKQHGGTIEVESEPGRFTAFRIILPRTGAAAAKSATSTTAPGA